MAKVFVQDPDVHLVSTNDLRRDALVVDDITASFEEEDDLIGIIEVSDVDIPDMASGFVYIGDIIAPQSSGQTVTGKTFQDPGNDTIIQTATVSGLNNDVLIRSSYPIVEVNGTPFTLPQTAAGIYEDTVNVTLLDGANTFTLQTPDDEDGAVDTITVTLSAPPALLTLSFTGSYPLGPTGPLQTELKAGDTFQLTGTTDKNADAVDIVDFGAMANSLEVFASGVNFTVTGTIADRGTTTQALAARVRARDATTGALGPTRDSNTGGGTVDGTNLVFLNSTFGNYTIGTPTGFPGSQQALKGSEPASVPISGITNTDELDYDNNGTGEISITNPNETGPPFDATKTVTRTGGTYNVSAANFRAVGTRLANGAQTTKTTVVNIANVATSITVAEPAARLRSGGNDGTIAQDHSMTISSTQLLLNAPTLDADAGGGTLQGAVWTQSGPNADTFIRDLRVDDNDTPTTYNWQSLVAINLAGLVATTITGDTTYIIGGFVSRDLIFGSFLQTTTLNAFVTTYTKLQATLFTATGGVPIRNPVQGDTSNLADTFTVTAVGVNPTALFWNDVAAASSNSSGTAEIQGFEETV